jgi:hypothetical protein
MNDVATWLSGAFGVFIVFAWLFVIVLVVGWIAFAGRRRAIRRGTHPLYLLPWYLGGPPKIDVDLPDDKRSARDRSRHP